MNLAKGFCKPKKRDYVRRINEGGNFCGHDRHNPLLSINCKSIRRPKVIKAAQKKLEEFYKDPSTLPMLQYARNSDRQRRSESREAEIQLIKVILEYTDLVTLRCGIPTETGFKPLTLDFLVKLTNLHKRRAERALSELVRVGLLSVHQPRQLVDNQWIGFAGIKTISKLLFKTLGLGAWLMFDRRKATKALLEKAKGAGSNIIEWTKAMLGRKKKAQNQNINNYLNREEMLRKHTELLIHLKQQYPDKTAEDINILADSLLFKSLMG